MGKAHVAPSAGGGEKPFVVGSYKGDTISDDWHKILLGFQPTAVLVEISGGKRSYNDSYQSYGGLALPGLPAYDMQREGREALRIVEDGFEVRFAFIYSASIWDYRYIAFR